MSGIGRLECPKCGGPIRFTTSSEPGNLSLKIDRGDVARNHAGCFSSGGGGERIAA